MNADHCPRHTWSAWHSTRGVCFLTREGWKWERECQWCSALQVRRSRPPLNRSRGVPYRRPAPAAGKKEA